MRSQPQKGAAACLIVHETIPAAYPFAVLVGSRSRENFELRAPDNNAGNVAMEGWLTARSSKKVVCRGRSGLRVAQADRCPSRFPSRVTRVNASFVIENHTSKC